MRRLDFLPVESKSLERKGTVPVSPVYPIKIDKTKRQKSPFMVLSNGALSIIRRDDRMCGFTTVDAGEHFLEGRSKLIAFVG